jgi:hypothetical protein
LSSGEAANEELHVLCHLDNEDPKLKKKEHFCTEGTWIINGKVVGFRDGFQLLYNDNPDVGKDKEIKI